MQHLLADTDDALAAQLAGDLNSLVGKFKQRLREQASMGDLTRSQAAVLRRLYNNGPATVTALARAENMRPQSMGATTSALQAAGLITGAPDPDDGRQTILSLTSDCREWIRDGRAARQDWLHRTILAELDPDERRRVADAVALLNRLVESARV